MSIKIYNRIALKRNNRYAFSDIEVYSFLFNQIVLKIVVNVAQIAKIERYEDSVNIDYYIFLTYPAKYYLTILKKDVACDDRFLWGWERVENFSFLRHNIIKNNDFLRLFLFNNTILTLKIKKTDLLDRGQGAKKAM